MKKKKKEKVWEISGYYYDGKTAYTLLVAADGSGKTKKIKGVA